MLKIDPNKSKRISFSINVENIDPQILEYNLRLYNEDSSYGIKGTNENGKISFVIPGLNEFLNESYIKSLKKIKS